MQEQNSNSKFEFQIKYTVNEYSLCAANTVGLEFYSRESEREREERERGVYPGGGRSVE